MSGSHSTHHAPRYSTPNDLAFRDRLRAVTYGPLPASNHYQATAPNQPTAPIYATTHGSQMSASSSNITTAQTLTWSATHAYSQPSLALITHPAPASKYSPTALITLIIGPSAQKLSAHSTFLTRSSDFFRVALKKEWKEGQTRTIELPEESTGYMQDYLDFLYEGKLPTHIYTENIFPTCLVFDHLAELYVLGERMLDSAFRNAIIQEIVRIFTCGGRLPRTSAVNIFYEGTVEGSPARRLLVDLTVRHSCPHVHTPDVDPAFSFDLMQAFLVAACSPSGVDGQRGLPLWAEEYFVAV